jgi:hypothetical protein
MKTKREMPLADALDEIAMVVEGLKENGSAKLDGRELKLDEPVTLEIESEAGKKKAELEFEIKWPAKKSAAMSADGTPKRRVRRRYIALGAVAAVMGAAALIAAQRRRMAGNEDEEDEI